MLASKLRAWVVGSAALSAAFQAGAQPQPPSPAAHMIESQPAGFLRSFYSAAR